MSLSEQAQARRSQSIDSGLQSVFASIKRSAEDGQTRVNFQIPREYLSEMVAAFKSLNFDVAEVSVGVQNSAQAELVVAWTTAIKTVTSEK